MQIWIRRIYDPPTSRDGARILVDRIWPRGISKQQARLQDWHRDVAPSTELRRWFAHDPDRWNGFRERYFAQLDANPNAVAVLKEAVREGRVTLVFAAGDQQYNNAVALREYLLDVLAGD
jgi:uncharacterized protein YeaO (DUF488 family)